MNNEAIQSRVRALVDEIAADNSSGAAEIVCRAAEAFSLLEENQSEADIERARKRVIEICAALVRAQPVMSPLARLASAVVAASFESLTADEVVRSAAVAARSFVDNAKRAAARTVTIAGEMIPNGARVLTHSRSSTALAAFVEARRSGKEFSVVATESRPLLEGRALAETLARENVNVTVIADAAAAVVLDEVDFVFVGADRVTTECVVNKIGTRMIALAARERAVPVYSLCDTSKFIAHDFGSANEQRSGDELWPGAPKGIVVINRYFEPTPLEYFAGVVTEDGALPSDEIARRARLIEIHQALLDALSKT
ncbi:MAG TPA: hypothetical protein VNN73_00430 [Blastocatellia bacterium]|nr:hypothetical protein [Blastocatellia bacterium]